jgi:hypothetical protein
MSARPLVVASIMALTALVRFATVSDIIWPSS